MLFSVVILFVSLFYIQIDDVECSQYNVERFLSSIDPAKDEVIVFEF